jgi:hypothetical protein
VVGVREEPPLDEREHHHEEDRDREERDGHARAPGVADEHREPRPEDRRLEDERREEEPREPEVPRAALREEEGAVAREHHGDGERDPAARVGRGVPSEESEDERRRRQHAERREEPSALHEPGLRVRREHDLQEPLGASEVVDEEERRHAEEDERRDLGEQVAREPRGDPERREERRGERGPRGDVLRQEVGPDVPAPLRRVRDVERRRQVGRRLEALRDRGLRRRAVRPEVHGRLGGLPRDERVGERVHVPDAGLRPLLDAALRHRLLADQLGDRRLGVVRVPRHDRALGADDDARRFEPALRAVRAVVALLGDAALLVQVEGVVGAGLHARTAADAAVAVQVHDRVGALVEGDHGTDLDARRRVAVVAAQHREVAADVREAPLLDVLDPGAEVPDRDGVLLLAGDRAGVAADALPVVDDEREARLAPGGPVAARLAGRGGAARLGARRPRSWIHGGAGYVGGARHSRVCRAPPRRKLATSRAPAPAASAAP